MRETETKWFPGFAPEECAVAEKSYPGEGMSVDELVERLEARRKEEIEENRQLREENQRLRAAIAYLAGI